MAAQSWAEWLSGLVSGLWPRLPLEPGSREAILEQKRLGALLDKELRKPVGQRDEELVHELRLETRKLALKNAQALRNTYKYGAIGWDLDTRQCCAAAQWAKQRIAASHRALAAFYEQVVQQREEDLAAAEARRMEVVAVQPTVRLELPEALQQAPPRLDMCSECAQNVQQMELAEERCRLLADAWRDGFRRRAEAAAASSGAQAGAAAAAAIAAPPAPPPAAFPPAGEVHQGQQLPSQQQQQQQQPLPQQHDCGGGGGAEGSPTTPKQQQQQQQPQQQHSSSDEEQR
jgi:hypothetical protein